MEDIGLALADFVGNMENVPSEIRHLFSEITDLDDKYEEAMSRAHLGERALQRELRDKDNRERACEKEETLIKSIDNEHLAAKRFCQEKVRLTKKAMTIVQRHLAKLDTEIRHFDKSPIVVIEPKRSGYSQAGTVGISNGELSSFRLPTPKRFSDSIPSLAMENAVTE
ncbi:Histone acetyltransferase complex subunit, partial [Coemansia sp. S2]